MINHFDSSSVKRAIEFATLAHQGQTRKYTNENYIVHPLEVAELVATVPHTEDMLVAAILHDTVEDTPVTIEEIHRIFGFRVALLVENLTDVSMPSDGNRATRKAKDLKHTATSSPYAKTIKLADLISNTKAIAKNDPAFAKVYLQEKELLLAVLTEGDKYLHLQATKLLKESFKRLETANNGS